MIAAAEEISAHWEAHCDDEGYGPANLMHRLEKGIPTEYAYTAGDFARLKDENEALRKDAERLEFLLRKVCFTGNGDGTCAMQIINLPCSVPGWPEPGEESVKAFARGAIDAAMTKEQKT